MPDRDPDSTAELLDDQVVVLAPAGRESSAAALRWLALALAVAVVIVVGVSIASRSEPPIAVVGSTAPTATDLIALETSAPSPTPNVNVCAEGSTDVQPVPSGADIGALTPLRLTRPGALALAIEEDRTSGLVIVSRSAGDEAGTVDSEAVARFTGYDINLPRTVTPVAWSTDGDAILINAGHLDQFEPERNCSDLFLVRADGSGVTRLTHNGAGIWSNAASISPNGKQVARVAGGDLQLIEVDGARAGLPLASCFNTEGPVRWSPDGTWLLLVCSNGVFVIDLVGERPHLYGPPAGPESEGSLPRDSLPLAAAWMPDGQSVVAVTANDGASQLGPLQIVQVKRDDGTPTARVATEASTEWVLGTATMSPDARWVLLQGDGNVPTDTWFPTYAVNTSTGDATKLPWTVIHDSNGPSPVSWLAEPGLFLYEDLEALYEVDLSTMTRTEVGAIPASDYAWFEAGAFAQATP
jgi:hypothetical protein